MKLDFTAREDRYAFSLSGIPFGGIVSYTISKEKNPLSDTPERGFLISITRKVDLTFKREYLDFYSSTGLDLAIRRGDETVYFPDSTILSVKEEQGEGRLLFQTVTVWATYISYTED